MGGWEKKEAAEGTQADEVRSYVEANKRDKEYGCSEGAESMPWTG